MLRRPRLRPDPGKTFTRRLSFSGWEAWEQLVLTYAGQASICLIRQTINALNVQIAYDRVVLHACVLEQNAETSLDLERIRSELEESLKLFVTPAPEVLLETATGINGPEWEGYAHMSIYKAHWSTQDE
jgi:hypothetical protein